MIVITSMTELPYSCMACPFQKNQKTPFCRAARNYKRGWSNIPAAFGFYIKDDAFADGQTPWNARAKWCPLIEVADIKTEPTISKMEQVDEPQIDNLATAIAHGAYCKTCKHLPDEDCDCDVVFTGYEPKDEPQTEEEKVREVVRGFMNIVNDMRNPTEEEKESVNKYIESISKPTGVNVFELMDEPQTEREGE